MSIYNDPEKYGLEIVGSIEDDEPWQFDMFVVWKRLSDGRILVGTDSGCSCPSPFEGEGVSDLTDIQDFAQFERVLQAYLDKESAADVAALKDKVRAALGS